MAAPGDRAADEHGDARRLAQESVSPDDAERGVAAVAADGPLTRAQLRERVASAGVRAEGQALIHVLALASIRGLIVRGPLAAKEQAFVLVRECLGAPTPAMDREAALGELARRYLAGHAPASNGDLAKWAGRAGPQWKAAGPHHGLDAGAVAAALAGVLGVELVPLTLSAVSAQPSAAKTLQSKITCGTPSASACSSASARPGAGSGALRRDVEHGTIGDQVKSWRLKKFLW